MPDVIVIEFSMPNAVKIYNDVNKILGWDGVPNSEELPAGMISHAAGESGDKLIVVEVWESRAEQENFLASKLGPALHQVKAPEPARMEWFSGVMNVHR
jgi:hypothetical protein